MGSDPQSSPPARNDRERHVAAREITVDGRERALRARVRRLRQQSAMALDALSAAQDRLAHDHEEHRRPQRAAQEIDDGQTTG
ncbi:MULTISPECIES: hypothetical protein [Streptomyces]|uniref:Uncharacterized protein n=1 Tax=Streptomyces venezuelae TaxID=54571 RepID=A0A5P2BCB3_STRVZ|nr:MULTISPECIES: hypothetical protein [Streptomyces]NEA04015.1 hypothetical protein [Streptomyces sp. SID10116]MYY85723.1 hypothetical protein [Streptomyces sp. SID335]MYZ17322.1 hypothetical protein [Streptomyces sp. SID337]NDZ86305.1 hypothetical protein [Streptomyces sp. SID10115]NEB44304.1 hypothetical protein [Streptomyces sp. SID339]